MSRKISSHQFILWLMAAEGAAVLYYLYSIPQDPKNVWIFGFSRTRLILLLGIVIVEAVLIWLALIFWRETKLSRQIQSKSLELAGKRGFLWGLLTFLVMLIVIGCLFLIQWRFSATNQQISAYLYRLSPLVLFGVVICIQTIFMLRQNFFKSERKSWFFALILLGGFVLLQCLLVAEFFLADQLFPEYYVNERYREVLDRWFPLIIFQTTFYIQLPYLIRNKLNIQLNFSWFVLLMVVILAYFYLNAAVDHAQNVNTELSRSDQDVYVEFTRLVSESNFTYTGVRNQTPGYPFIQALFCNRSLTDQDLFMCGKQVNIVLSIVFIFLLFLLFNRYLRFYPSFVLLLIIVVSLFIFKAGYMTVEVTFYFASFLSFLLMCKMLIKPTIKLGIVTGIILGITHLLKASVLPGFVLFIFIFIVKVGWDLSRNKPAEPKLKTSIPSLLLTICCFFVLVFPYIRQSKEMYGKYFYNVNTSFYIWYDSWADAKQAEQDHGFTLGWPDLPKEQLPGLNKYIQEHSNSQIFERVWFGFVKQISHISNQYSVFNYYQFYFILATVALLLNRESAKFLFWKHFLLFLFFVLYISGYILLFAWYFPIAGGPRFVASLLIPILFSIFIVIDTLLDRRNEIKFMGYKINQSSAYNFIDILVVSILITDGFIIITQKLPVGYFGS